MFRLLEMRPILKVNSFVNPHFWLPLPLKILGKTDGNGEHPQFLHYSAH